MKTAFLGIIPVLPSANIARDLAWYKEKTGFEEVFSDNMYACICRNNIYMHLQWHADTESDPLLGGSVIRLYVKNIQPLFDEFVQRGTITSNALKINTPWNTNEFGFFDLNKNAIFVMEDV
ncbi:MAG: hypothetical protein JO072_16070 [Parafilimonas sp.]|nr:hypothetical protein [Parafilimonas sp.]